MAKTVHAHALWSEDETCWVIIAPRAPFLERLRYRGYNNVLTTARSYSEAYNVHIHLTCDQRKSPKIITASYS